MASEPGDRITPDGADRELLYRSVYDPAEPDSLLTAVTEAIGAVVDERPMDLAPPLATVAAWDSLERLMSDDAPAPVDRVGFSYRGLTVVVRSDGEVRIYDD